MRVLLDTSAYSALHRGDRVVAGHVRRSDEALLSIGTLVALLDYYDPSRTHQRQPDDHHELIGSQRPAAWSLKPLELDHLRRRFW